MPHGVSMGHQKLGLAGEPDLDLGLLLFFFDCQQGFNRACDFAKFEDVGPGVVCGLGSK